MKENNNQPEDRIPKPGPTIKGAPPAAHGQQSDHTRWRLKDGHEFGEYRIVRFLGEGGMGTVYQAWDGASQRNVALKLLRGKSESPEARELFLREGQLAASLKHRNTVYVFKAEEIEGRRAILMELVWGGTLSDMVRKRGTLAPKAAADAIIQIIDGLNAALQLGILHCDMKPNNCFVDANGTIKVGDFGLAVTSRTASREGVKVLAEGGTPGFAAPEQIRNEPIDFRADIYSVGVTLYFLLTGQLPFSGHGTEEILKQTLSEPAPSRRSLRHHMPPPLAAIVCRCLAKEPRHRFQSYAAFREALVFFSLLWTERPRSVELYIVSLAIIGTLMALMLMAQFSKDTHNLVPLWCFLALTPFAALQVLLIRSGSTAFVLRCVRARMGGVLHSRVRLGRFEKPGDQSPSRLTPIPAVPPRTIGPYQVIAEFSGGTGSERTILAFDPSLLREVWIRLRSSEAGTAYTNPAGRPTRLRLQASHRSNEGCWDVYEAVPGQALLLLAATPQPWKRVRVWLLWLANELAAAAAEQSVPSRLRPEQIWISQTDVPILLDFEAPGLDGSAEMRPTVRRFSHVDLQIFLKRVAFAALEGRLFSATEAEMRASAIPLPEHARKFLLRLGTFGTLNEISYALREVKGPATEASPLGRLAASLCGGFLIGFTILAELNNPNSEGSALIAGIAFAIAAGIVALTRSNFWLRNFRLRVVTSKGGRPERWRHGFRMLLILGPFYALLISLTSHLNYLSFALGSLILTGFVWTLASPDRGLHDRLSGTCIVPDE